MLSGDAWDVLCFVCEIFTLDGACSPMESTLVPTSLNIPSKVLQNLKRTVLFNSQLITWSKQANSFCIHASHQAWSAKATIISKTPMAKPSFRQRCCTRYLGLNKEQKVCECGHKPVWSVHAISDEQGQRFIEDQNDSPALLQQHKWPIQQYILYQNVGIHHELETDSRPGPHHTTKMRAGLYHMAKVLLWLKCGNPCKDHTHACMEKAHCILMVRGRLGGWKPKACLHECVLNTKYGK